MRVHVRPLRLRGRNLNRDELKDFPPYMGVLKVAETRDHELGRPVVRARLIDPVAGTEADVLPELCDARLLWAEGTSMRLTGFERIEAADYMQTWTVELA
jgi:hypothetical protein